MKIIATNIGKRTIINFNGKEIETGIFKKETAQPIFLGSEMVKGDTVSDRKHHGGKNKACYIFNQDQYPFWKEQYPDLDWHWGFFGENLTVSDLDENTEKIGNIYKVGQALVQISIPREPCFKLGACFKDQHILKKFITHARPGVYLKVLEEGLVQKGDEFKLIKTSKNALTVAQFFTLLFAKEKDTAVLNLAIENETVPLYKRERLRKYL